MSAVAQLPRPARARPAVRPGPRRPAPAVRPAPPGALTRFASYLGSTWILAGAGVVILVISMVLMAHAAPGQRPASPPLHSAQHAPGPGHHRATR